MSCKRRSICEDHVIANAAVVSNVGLSHNEIIRAYFRQVAAALGATLKSGELAEDVAFPGAQETPLASIFQILRSLSGGHKGVEDRFAPELGRAFNHAVTCDSNIIVQDDVVADD
jgi:hypothetical protein